MRSQCVSDFSVYLSNPNLSLPGVLYVYRLNEGEVIYMLASGMVDQKFDLCIRFYFHCRYILMLQRDSSLNLKTPYVGTSILILQKGK